MSEPPGPGRGRPRTPFSRELARRVALDVRPLREVPAFRRLFIGGVASSIGSQMTTFALMLQVYDVTRSSAAVGALGAARLVPTLAIGLVGGSLADSLDRRRLVVMTSSGQGIVSALFALGAFFWFGALWPLYLLAGAQAALSSIGQPARRTFIPRLLRPELISAGVALNQVTLEVSRLCGPALAGVLTAAFGLRTCYVVDVATFSASLYGLARLGPMAPTASIARAGITATLEGARYIRRNMVLKAAFLVDLDATVLGMPIALFPALNAAHFGGHATTLGLITSAPAIGGIVGACCSGPTSRIHRRGRAMLVAASTWGVGIAVFGAAHNLALAVIGLAIAGAADGVTVISRATLVQLVTPDRFRGRVSAADYVVGAGGGYVGNIEAGVVGSLFTPEVSAVSGGIASVLGAIAIACAIPEFSRHDDRRAISSSSGDPDPSH